MLMNEFRFFTFHGERQMMRPKAKTFLGGAEKMV